MLALILSAALTPVEYFPDAGSGRSPSPTTALSHAVPDPARALLEDPTPANALAFIEWREAEEERLRAALEAIDAVRPRETRPIAPARGDLLAEYRRPSSPQRAP